MSRDVTCEVVCDGCTKTVQEKDEHDIPNGWTYIMIQRPTLTGLGRRPGDRQTREIDLCEDCATPEHLKRIVGTILRVIKKSIVEPA